MLNFQSFLQPHAEENIWKQPQGNAKSKQEPLQQKNYYRKHVWLALDSFCTLYRYYLPHYSQKVDLMTGVNAEESIAVTFHCILPKPLWEWNDESCIHIHFERHPFGMLNNDVGDFKKIRCVLDISSRVSDHAYVHTSGQWIMAYLR